MKVILLQDIKNVGRKEQVLEANDGYARNYLFPKKLSEANKKKAEIDANKEIAKKIEKMELTIKAKVGENSKIFGGITSKEIAEELKKQHNFEIDKKKIVLKETIKNLGRYTAELKFGDGINAKLTVNVTGE